MTVQKTKIQWLDTLRTLAALGVILIHTASPLNRTFLTNINYWWIGNTLMSLTRYAVPMFLMISGATMLGREYKLKDFYERRLMRVVVPFFFWLIVYFFFRYFTLHVTNPPVGFNNILNWAVSLFLNEGVSKHFWYIYMMIFIYLFLPLLSKLVNLLNTKYLVLLVVFWVIITILTIHIPANVQKFTDMGRLIKYVIFMGYLVLGFFLYTHISPTKKIRFYTLIVFFITIIISALTVYFTSRGTKNTNLSIYSYLSLNTIIQTSSLFLLIKGTNIKNKLTSTINASISDYSYGIYLVHILVLGVLFDHGIWWKMAHPLISIPAVFILVLTISYSIIFLLRKIPCGKYISG